MKKIFAAIVVLLMLAACGSEDAGEYVNGDAPDTSRADAPDYDYLPPEDDYQAAEAGPSVFGIDAIYMVNMIEEVHPIFIIDGMLPDNYEEVRDEFLAYAANDISRQQFVFAARRYLTIFQDGHMGGGFGIMRRSGGGALVLGNFLDVNWVLRDERLFLSDENGRPTNAEVMEIGGIPVAKVLELIDAHYFSENEADRQRNHGIFARYGALLELGGAEIIDRRVILKVFADGETSTKEVMLNVPMPKELETTGMILGSGISHEIWDDIFYIDLRAFVNDRDIDITASYIEEAINDGIRKFIVDLRGNPGGDSRAGSRLLEAMGVVTPDYGSIHRISDLAISQRMSLAQNAEVYREMEYRLVEPNAEAAENPNGVFISVLTDAGTFSSATMFSAWVQDGNLGNIIGSPSRNKPSMFGDMLAFDLPSGLFTVAVSHGRFMRPDTNADQITLHPDILVDPEIALDVALEFLRNLEDW